MNQNVRMVVPISLKHIILSLLHTSPVSDRMRDKKKRFIILDCDSFGLRFVLTSIDG